MLKYQESDFYQDLKLFRKNIGLKTSLKFVEGVLHGRITTTDDHKPYLNSLSKEKLFYLERVLREKISFRFIKYIGITGSVASGNVKKNDDIDIIVVTRNYSSWIARLILRIELGDSYYNYGDYKKENTEDKICVNYILEERAVSEHNSDIFNLHEILYMIPVYNPEYKQDFIKQNSWIYRWYGKSPVEIQTKISHSLKNVLYYFLNYVAFWGQFMFMRFSQHRPRFQRLIQDFYIGRIRFYPLDFKPKVIREFNKLKED